MGPAVFVATWRLTHPKIQQANWMLRIIATPSGRASLSQLQIVLWTLVVAGSAVYVMAASGALIQISNGTLVLLGIAGAAGIASKAHSQGQDAAAAAAGTPPEITTPRLSDLLMSDSGQGEVGEIDVARMQMLMFTVIAAVFVTAKVFVSFVIPDIPEGIPDSHGHQQRGVYGRQGGAEIGAALVGARGSGRKRATPSVAPGSRPYMADGMVRPTRAGSTPCCRGTRRRHRARWRRRR